LLAGSTTGSSKGRTAVDNQTVRTVFVIGPDKKVKLFLAYPMATGRNFLEILMVLFFLIKFPDLKHQEVLFLQ